MLLYVANTTGILVIALSMLVALFTGAALENPGLGLLVGGASLAGASTLIWKKSAVATRRWPSFFFIPLPIWSIPVMALGVYAMVSLPTGDGRRAPVKMDPRLAELKSLEDSLRSGSSSGDSATQKRVRAALATLTLDGSPLTASAIITRTSPQGVLVLVKIDNLRKVKDSDRPLMAQRISEGLDTDPALAGKPRYIGVKGLAAFGIISTPAGLETGSVLPPASLLGFFGTKPGTAPATPNANPTPAPPGG